MIYSLLGSFSSFESYWRRRGGGGAPRTTSISYSAKVCITFKVQASASYVQSLISRLLHAEVETQNDTLWQVETPRKSINKTI